MFSQPPLPYALNALAPFLNEEQMSFHYGKHHAAYVTNLTKLTDGKPEASWSLRDIIAKCSAGVFNNGAQIWNHSFFWNCMSPKGGGEPTGTLAAAIVRDFGSVQAFRDQFATSATTLFGSGWAWLAKTKEGKLEILQGPNADNPIRLGKEPILTVDVWEHAYYIDYRNRRPDFVKGFWDKTNWSFAQGCFDGKNTL